MDHIVQASVQWQEKLILLVVGCDLERRFDWIVTAEWRSSQFFSDHVFPRHYWLFPVKTEENVVQHFWLVVSVDFQASLNWLKAGAHFYKILFGVSENPATLVFDKNWNCRGEEVEKATYFLYKPLLANSSENSNKIADFSIHVIWASGFRNDPKFGSGNRDVLNLLIGLPYIGWHHVNPHFQSYGQPMLTPNFRQTTFLKKSSFSSISVQLWW